MLKEEKIKLKKKLNNIYHCKKISNEDYEKAFYIVNKFKNEDSFFFYFNLGKILFLKSDFQNAKYYLERALELNNTNAGLYYSLYKLDVRLGDFQEAFLDLFKYKQLCGSKLDINLPLTMLEQIIDLDYNKDNFYSEDYEITKTNYFGTCYIKNEQILDLYNKMINLFNSKAFFKLKDKNDELKKVINEINFPIEVDTLEIIINQLIIKINEYNKNNVKDSINNIQNIEIENLPSIIQIALDENLINQRQLLIEVHKLINIDLEKASLLLSYININQMEIEYTYLKNIIDEKEKYNSFNEEKQKKYDYFIKIGKKSLKEKKYDLAYQYYLSGKCCTNHPIFNYYLGKVLYKQKKYEEAEKYFLIYSSYGGEKYLKSLLYLGYIYKHYNKILNIKKCVNKIEIINDIFYQDNKINCSFLKMHYGNIRIAEKDLLVDNSSLDIKYYYDYSFSEKLAFIRKIFLLGRNNMAEKLLKELITIDDEEKNMINRLLQDKQLLKIKSKSND